LDALFALGDTVTVFVVVGTVVVGIGAGVGIEVRENVPGSYVCIEGSPSSISVSIADVVFVVVAVVVVVNIIGYPSLPPHTQNSKDLRGTK